MDLRQQQFHHHITAHTGHQANLSTTGVGSGGGRRHPLLIQITPRKTRSSCKREADNYGVVSALKSLDIMNYNTRSSCQLKNHSNNITSSTHQHQQQKDYVFTSMANSKASSKQHYVTPLASDSSFSSTSSFISSSSSKTPTKTPPSSKMANDLNRNLLQTPVSHRRREPIKIPSAPRTRTYSRLSCNSNSSYDCLMTPRSITPSAPVAAISRRTSKRLTYPVR